MNVRVAGVAGAGAEARAARLGRMYAALSEANEALFRLRDEREMYRCVCDLAVQYGGLKLAAVRLVDPDSKWIRPAVHAGTSGAYLERAAVSVDPDEPLAQGAAGRAAREGRTTVSNDFQHDPDLRPWQVAAAEAGIASTSSVPLRRGGKVIGLLSLYSAEPGWFDAELVSLVERLAANLSFALDSLDRDALRRRAEAVLEAEKRVLELIALGRPVPEVLETLVRVVELQSADGMVGSVLLLDAEGKRLRHGAAPGLPAAYCAAIDGLEIGPQVGSCGTAAYSGRRVIVSDIRSDPLWAAFRELAATHGLVACWSTPIKSRSGKVLGTFAMYYREARAPSTADLELIERTEHLAGIVLERDLADVALRNAEAHLRRIFDALPLAIGHVGRDERYIAVNLSLEALLERAREEIVGYTVREVLGEEAYAETRPHIEAVMLGKEVAFERRRKRADGLTLWLRVQYVPEVDAEGVRGYFVLVSDISEQKRAELAAREGEERFRKLTELTSDWYWEQDAEFRFTVLSGPGAAALADGEVSKYLGNTRWESGDLEPLEGDWAAHRAMLEKHQPFHDVVLRRSFADGREGFMSVSGEPLFAADGRFAGYRGVAKNVSERVRVEQALRESEERFRSLSKLSTDFYWETDSGHRFKSLPDERALNRGNSDRTVGMAAWEVPSVHPSEEGWRAQKARMDGHLPFRDFEFARQRDDGEAHWWSVSGEPVFDAGGNFTGYRGVGREVTDRKRTEQELERLAHYDKLTALPNRAMLQDRLAQALQRARRSKTLLAVMFLDLDRFKDVNDSLGHAAGDELLQSVAKRLTGCVRSTDTVARLGGDEFTVLLEGVRNVEEIDLVARKILAAVAQPHSAAGHELCVSTSVGVTVYPLDDQDQETLLKNADHAMYQAKQAGRNNVQYFAHESGARRS